MTDDNAAWYMNVAVRPHTQAHAAAVGLRQRRRRGRGHLAAGFAPAPGADLTYMGGHTISALRFVNVYCDGTSMPWSQADREAIDNALEAALADAGLNGIIQQYFPDATVSGTMLPSRRLARAVPERVFKDTIEGIVGDEWAAGALAGLDDGATVVNYLLGPHVVLDAGASHGHVRRAATAVALETEEADSLHGLGGYHGSVHVTATSTIYYAVGVYSEPTSTGENGIVAFDEPWKNVVATFYHELQEARTDPDVEDVNRGGADTLLGWYASGDGQLAGEIGDTPIEEAGADLGKVMKEVPLADGSGTVPVQLMWSNRAHGPAEPTHRRAHRA